MTLKSQRKKDSSLSKRRYLSSSERKQEILEAAFQEFSSGGFLATSMEKIATRAGISKSGIYAHYKSKNDIFEDVLLTTLLPANTHTFDLGIEDPINLSQLLDQYLDKKYVSLSTSRAISAFRLLVAESARTPKLVQRCAQKLIERSLTDDRKFIDTFLKSQLTDKDLSIDQHLLSNSPFGLWLILMTVFGNEASPVSVKQIKTLHKQPLIDFLQTKS